MYAPRAQLVAAPIEMRLIGVLDADLVATFAELARGLGTDGVTVLVDVRDLTVTGEDEMNALAGAVASARDQGRDVRLDARSLHWKRAAKKKIFRQPAIGAELRSGVRRTVIIAHSARRKRSPIVE